MIQNAYVGLGSNLGDRAGYLLLAVRGMLDAGLDVIRLSSIYETEPVEYEEQPAFLNMVAELRGTTLPSPEQTLARLLRIEYSLGRTREVPLGPRTIDLDLLIFKDLKSESDFLRLPHPRMAQRRFVLVPFAELVPNLVHPVLGRKIRELLEKTSDRSEVIRWKEGTATEPRIDCVISGYYNARLVSTPAKSAILPFPWQFDCPQIVV